MMVFQAKRFDFILFYHEFVLLYTKVFDFLGWFVVMYDFARALLGFDVACALFTTFLWFFDS